MNIRDWNKCIDLAFTAIFFAYFVVFSKLQEIELHDKTINCYKLRPRKHDRQYVNPHILMTLYSVRMYKKMLLSCDMSTHFYASIWIWLWTKSKLKSSVLSAN